MDWILRRILECREFQCCQRRVRHPFVVIQNTIRSNSLRLGFIVVECILILSGIQLCFLFYVQNKSHLSSIDSFLFLLLKVFTSYEKWKYWIRCKNSTKRSCFEKHWTMFVCMYVWNADISKATNLRGMKYENLVNY